MIEDRVSKFELRGTVNLHLHGTVNAKILFQNSYQNLYSQHIEFLFAMKLEPTVLLPRDLFKTIVP